MLQLLAGLTKESIIFLSVFSFYVAKDQGFIFSYTRN